MSSLRHITPSSRHMMMSNALQSLFDRSFIVSRCLSGNYHALFIMWSFSIMLYHLFSHHMSYAPILTHPRTNSFPMTMISLCSWWFIRSHNPLHFLNDLINRSHPPSCLCSLLLFYLWFAHLWSPVMATLFILKLYQVVWLELSSFVTSVFPHPSALTALKVKLSYILSTLCTLSNLLPLLCHSSNSKAYLE